MPNKVYTVRQMLIGIFAQVGTLVITLDNRIASTERTLWNINAMPDFRESLIPFFCICRHHQLSIHNAGSLVVADPHRLLTCIGIPTAHSSAGGCNTDC
jgi:hypothetical protein